MLAAAPVLNLSSNTKASIVYFRDLFKVRSWSWRDICVCAGARVCVSVWVYVKPLVLGRGFGPGTGNQSISSAV